MRRHNRTALLRRLHTAGPCTRAQLASDLGLNRSTIKALVDELTAAGLVDERVPDLRVGAGRPSLLVAPRPAAVFVLAVDLDVEHVTAAMVGVGGEVLGVRRWPLPRGASQPRDVVADVCTACRELVAQLGGEPVGIGVSVPGVVRQRDGLVHEAPNLRWTAEPLGERLGEALGLPVWVANDADLGALAEHVRGAARDAQDVVYLCCNVGVGGGVIVGGRSLRGSSGYVGELGHMVVHPGGLPCYCGSAGCWETEIGEDGLARALGLPEGTQAEVLVAQLRALAATPVQARQQLADFAFWLTLGLVNVVNVLAPELVVIGGLLAALPRSVVDDVEAAVSRRSLVARAAGGVRVATATLSDRASLVGAAELAFERALATT